MTWGIASIRVGSVATLLLLPACAAPDGSIFPSLTGNVSPSGVASESDACGAPKDCAAHLKKLVSSSNRDWIGVPQTPDGYADGTRLFAYRALRKKLACNELRRAIEDTKAATVALQEPGYERARPLVAEVARELAAEQGRRCRGSSG